MTADPAMPVGSSEWEEQEEVVATVYNGVRLGLTLTAYNTSCYGALNYLH
jgi:hypothetical protein